MMSLGLIATLAVVAWIGAGLRSGAPVEPGQGPVAQVASAPEHSPVAADSAPAEAEPALNVDAAMAYAATRPLVSLVVADRQTGTYLDNGPLAHTPMGSASVIKVLMADELLYRCAKGDIELGTSERQRMEAMLIASDDSAASSLYSQFGGVSLIEAGLSRHELTESGPPVDARFWGNTLITAYDIAKFYGNVLTGSLSPADQDYLFGLLRGISPVAADGFNQVFGMNGGPAQAAVKQGWMCCLDDVRNVHSTAVLGAQDRYVVVILTQYPTFLPFEYGQATATEVARLVVDQLTL